MRVLNQIKKIIVLLVAMLSISIISVNNASAVNSWDYYLQVIAQNTYSILDRLNNVPTYLQNITVSLLSLMKQDSDEGSLTFRTQNLFAALGANFSQQEGMVNNLQRQLTADMLNVPIADFDTPERNPKILQTLPNVNDLAYATLLNQPPVGGARNAYNYIKNAAGFSIIHEIPKPTWQGNDTAKEKYTAYFNTVTAIESYNAYLISKLMAEASANPPSKQLQDNLIAQASSSNWIAEIATEEIGKVLRHILLFQSQNYVLNAQIQKTMQDIVTAQAMGNSLQILFNQPFESQMVRDAKGLPPGR